MPKEDLEDSVEAGKDAPAKEKPKKEPKPPKEKKDKKKDKNKDEDESKGGGFLGKFIIGLLFLAFVGGVSAFLFFNVFGVRNNYVIPELRKVPVVKNIIPALPGEEVIDETNPDSTLSKKQLLEKIALLEKQIEDMTKTDSEKETHIKSLNDKIIELQKYEDEQTTFKENKEAFDIMIGNHDPNAYAAFYEQIDPVNAEKIYADAVKKIALDDDTKKYTATFQDMKAASAATILEEMMRTNSETVILVMENVDSKQRAAILAAMTPRNAAFITKRLIPEQNP